MARIGYYYPEGHQAHFEYGHPERPERVETICERLKAENLWDDYPKLSPAEVAHDLLNRVDTPEYIALLQKQSRESQPLDMDTYITRDSWRLALNAAGGAISIAKAVWDGEIARGFALTRPPGHHATHTTGMGFCLLNNIAIATEYLLQTSRAKRLMILDFDLHHGNGTQDIFWERGDVFYLSTHQSPLYPGTGSIYEIGLNAGKGATLNIPLPPGSGDGAFNSLCEQIILPMLDRFSPEMLLISYGFDPHWKDPLGHLLLSATGYSQLLGKLSAWADQSCEGKIALFLEGGYALDAGEVCSVGVISTMLGKDWIDGLGTSPRAEGKSWQSVIMQIKQIHNL